MVKTYYRNEYTEKQWKALIDKGPGTGLPGNLWPIW